MNADPDLKQRLSRAVDPLDFEVEGRLRSLHRGAPRRRLVHKAGVIAVAASIAVLGAGAAIRLAPASRIPHVGSETSSPQGHIAYTGGSAALELSLFTVSASGDSNPIAVPTDVGDADAVRQLVERTVDANDRRNVRAALTPVGRAAYERASAILAEHERAIDERLGQAPRAELARGLQTLREG